MLVLREYRAADLRTDGTGPAIPKVVFTFDLTRAKGLFLARQFQINPGDTVLVTENPVIAVHERGRPSGDGIRPVKRREPMIFQFMPKPLKRSSGPDVFRGARVSDPTATRG